MTKLGVRPRSIDAFEAALWYESERPGLGIEFIDALRAACRQIEGMPLRFRMVSGDVRRAILIASRSACSSSSRAIGRRS